MNKKQNMDWREKSSLMLRESCFENPCAFETLKSFDLSNLFISKYRTVSKQVLNVARMFIVPRSQVSISWPFIAAINLTALRPSAKHGENMTKAKTSTKIFMHAFNILMSFFKAHGPWMSLHSSKQSTIASHVLEELF